jgi:hypothetical protein
VRTVNTRLGELFVQEVTKSLTCPQGKKIKKRKKGEKKKMKQEVKGRKKKKGKIKMLIIRVCFLRLTSNRQVQEQSKESTQRDVGKESRERKHEYVTLMRVSSFSLPKGTIKNTQKTP